MCENDEETTYYVRTHLMYKNVTKKVLFKVFEYLIKSEDIEGFLSSPEQKNKLWNLWKGKNPILNKDEYNRVSDRINLERIDISLLLKLILNLFKDKIQKPRGGWETKQIQQEDKSLGADLLRLRNIRNKFIGHRANTKLSETEYELTWANIKAIFLRVVELVDSKSSDVFQQRIDEYEAVHLKKNLPEKAEELIRRSQRLSVYVLEGLGRYVRYIKVLFYGGRIVLCRILKTKLGDQDLSNVLERKKEKLTGNIEETYYSQASCSDYENWDVARLAEILLLVCNDDLTPEDIEHIEGIKSIRVNLKYAALKCLDPNEFASVWTKLVTSLYEFFKNILEEDQRQVENLIDRYKEYDKGGCDAELCIKQLREFEVEYNVSNGTITELRDILQQLSQRNIKFKKEHVIELRLLTNCENEETKKKAEDLLKKCLQNSIQKSDEPEGPVEKEIVKLLAILSAVPDVNVQENRKRKGQTSINYPIKCRKKDKSSNDFGED